MHRSPKTLSHKLAMPDQLQNPDFAYLLLEEVASVQCADLNAFNLTGDVCFEEEQVSLTVRIPHCSKTFI